MDDPTIKGPILYFCKEHVPKSDGYYCTNPEAKIIKIPHTHDPTQHVYDYGLVCAAGLWKALPHLKNVQALRLTITRHRTKQSVKVWLVDHADEGSPYPEWTDEHIEVEATEYDGGDIIDITTDFGEWLLENIDDAEPFYINGAPINVT